MIRFLLNALLFSLFVLSFPAIASAGGSKKIDYRMTRVEASLDSVPGARQSGDKKQTVDKKKEGNNPEIKEVPKSRRQLKPSAVKGRVKTKPVKIPKPKVIKKNIGRGLKLIK